MSERAGHNSALIIFIKNAESGRVKTRIAGEVGDEQALYIYRQLLAHTLKECLKVQAEKYLYYSAFIDAEDEWSSQDFYKRLQQGRDLGERMATAFRSVLQASHQAVIIGSDCPGLTSDLIHMAFEKLDHSDVVVGPSLDGGYYLLGMKKPYEFLFEDIIWSTETVFQTTVSRIEQAGLNFSLLPTLADVDYYDDWLQYGWS
jgi:rSAM/selenodomain-associated transferase 1